MCAGAADDRRDISPATRAIAIKGGIMCGIAGIMYPERERPVARDVLLRMNQKQAHRGPDEGGVFLGSGVGLGHRRLSIIDLAGGQQPLHNEDGTVTVVFNGEIYNFAALAEQLAGHGHTLKTRSDTEVIVHAWEQWGAACVERFNGMFAFALWDQRSETLFLARDRLGIKPLHYALLPDRTLLFASEIKALLAYPHPPPALNPNAIEQYFAFGYVIDPATIYKEIFTLQPGHTLTLPRGTSCVSPKRYWSPHPKTTLTGITENDAISELIERLRAAVAAQLVSDVPIGAFLSGGVDSSAVVAMMAESVSGELATCSIGFEEQRYDEAPFAAVVSRRYKTHHLTEKVRLQDPAMLDTIAALYDQPFADSSALPTYHLCKLARSKVTVALSGDGGDELFGGYPWYRGHLAAERVRRIIPAPLRRILFGTAAQCYSALEWSPRVVRGRRTLERLASDSVEGLARAQMIAAPEQRARLFSESFQQSLQGYRASSAFHECARLGPQYDSLSLAQHLDLSLYLPCDILTKVDRTSMAHALEVRVPLLDHTLVEWCTSLPSHLKLRGRSSKYILKQALNRWLPETILQRPKQGFSIPVADWLRGPLAERVRSTVLSARMLAGDTFNPHQLKTVVNNHLSGTRDHSALLWALVIYDRFLARIDGEQFVES